jgi:hypothetical protein
MKEELTGPTSKESTSTKKTSRAIRYEVCTDFVDVSITTLETA